MSPISPLPGHDLRASKTQPLWSPSPKAAAGSAESWRGAMSDPAPSFGTHSLEAKVTTSWLTAGAVGPLGSRPTTIRESHTAHHKPAELSKPCLLVCKTRVVRTGLTGQFVTGFRELRRVEGSGWGQADGEQVREYHHSSLTLTRHLGNGTLICISLWRN